LLPTIFLLNFSSPKSFIQAQQVFIESQADLHWSKYLMNTMKQTKGKAMNRDEWIDYSIRR